MADIISDFLERATEAKGDPQIQAALAAKFVLAAVPEPEQAALRASLDVRAAPLVRSCSSGKNTQNFRRGGSRSIRPLKSLPFVERYRRGESELHNVHNSTRLGWRRHMARANLDGFRFLSIRAAACFVEDLTPVGRIEYMYHLLCADPDRGANELLKLGLAAEALLLAQEALTNN